MDKYGFNIGNMDEAESLGKEKIFVIKITPAE